MTQSSMVSAKPSSPIVSVIIPAYNARFLADAVKSVCNQTYKNFELIVVDDGSPGSSIKEICNSFPEARFIRQANAGPSVARNRGVSEANGELIAFLDDDDTWLPEKLDRQVKLFESLPDREKVGLIYTGQYLFGENVEFGSKVDEANGMIYPYLLFGNFIGTCSSVMIPKHVFDKVGLYDTRLICSQDFELYLRISRNFEIHSISEPLIRYRTRPDQISKDPTLNNADDLLILNGQKDFVEPEFYKKVEQFHREVASLRYKETAYDALFRAKDRRAYRKWIIKSIIHGRKPPSAGSIAYFALTLGPSDWIDKVSRMSGRSDNKHDTPQTSYYQNIREDFVWMGVRRSKIMVSQPVTR